MNRRHAGWTALAALLAAAGTGWAQQRAAAAAAPTDQTLERQKGKLEQNLQKRIADIETRFAEEHAFRAGQKDQRIEFERKLMRDRKAFLDSLKRIKLEQRGKALDAFYARQRDKRKEFNDRRRAESRQFWEARLAQRQDSGRQGGGK